MQTIREIQTMPVKVTNGDKLMEVYEYTDGFAMTTEFLGRCLGFKNPKDGMANLFRHNKEVLEPHRFAVTATANPQGGRPPKFYDSEGIVLAASRTKTPEAKLFLPAFLTRLKVLEAKRIARIEAYWFGRKQSSHWKEVRERAMHGENFQQISDAMACSDGKVRYAINKMITVGILAAARAAQVLTGTARKAVLRYEQKIRNQQAQLSFWEASK